MTEKLDMDGWGEVTIRTPGAFADPREMNAVMRELFCRDSILDYQRRITEAAMRSAVASWRRVINSKLKEGTGMDGVTLKAMETVLDSFDPDHDEWDGFYPSVMLCPEHDSPVTPRYGKGIVFADCPGVPWCKAHEGVAVREK